MTASLQRPHHLNPRLDTARVVLAHRDFSATGASHVGMSISAAYTAKTLRQDGVWAEVWAARDPAALGDRLRVAHTTATAHGDVRPTHVIIEAPWVPTSELAALAAAFPDVVFVVICHSNVGFLAVDPGAIRILRQVADLQLATHNVCVGGNAKKFTDWATAAWRVNAVWLPNLYGLSETFPNARRPWSGRTLRLGLFGADRPWKNHLGGAAAAVELAARLAVPTELFLSTGRTDGAGMQALTALTEGIRDFKVTPTGWLAWPAFRQLLRSIDLVFQVSYTETFNVVAADAIAEGVPVVGSEAIEWLPRWWQARIDEPRDAARVGESLLRDPDAARDGRAALETYVAQGLAVWRRFLAPAIASSAGLAEAAP